MAKEYTIREVSKKFNLAASTLRYYEEIGLLTNVERTNSGKRIYFEKHINRLKTICCFKNTGMSISTLKKFFIYEEDEDINIDKIIELLNMQRNLVEKQLNQLNHDYEHIKRKLAYYKDIKTAFQENKPHPLWKNYKNN